ncbi:MAG TPA: hypothetical protein VFN07_10920 [Trueperaceae bacterium]|nr:hypothetical protein [Trueperaceae bacterium]
MTSTLTRSDLAASVRAHQDAQANLRRADAAHCAAADAATDARLALLAELEARQAHRVVVAGHLVEVTERHGVRGVSVTPVEVLP